MTDHRFKTHLTDHLDPRILDPLTLFKHKVEMNLGKVYLVGAGPGDPGLMTVKGLECLRRADVIVYDRLVDESILKEANRQS